MSIQSMTGYARAEGADDTASWVWELKSVNGRGLDVRLRLPSGCDRLDARVRTRIGKRFKRGSINASLSIEQLQTGATISLNTALLDEIADAEGAVRERFPDATPPSVDGLLALRGVIEADEGDTGPDDMVARDDAVIATLDDALDGLGQARAAEGAHLRTTLADHLAGLETLCKDAEQANEMQAAHIRQRLKAQVEDLMTDVPALPEERLAQEAAIAMTKADPREELDRLKGHCEAARVLLESDDAIGRKLDFLCQEFNREANTLCAKAQDMSLTRIGLDIKTVIDQIREQVQNVE